MPNESVEVQLARLEERLKTIFEMLERERDNKTAIYDELKSLGKGMTSIEGRVENVEGKLTQQAPTIEEFITIKHKVVGAGIAGKWTWAIAGGLISFLWSAKKEIAAWFGN